MWCHRGAMRWTWAFIIMFHFLPFFLSFSPIQLIRLHFGFVVSFSHTPIYDVWRTIGFLLFLAIIQFPKEKKCYRIVQFFFCFVLFYFIAAEVCVYVFVWTCTHTLDGNVLRIHNRKNRWYQNVPFLVDNDDGHSRWCFQMVWRKENILTQQILCSHCHMMLFFLLWSLSPSFLSQ